MGQMTVYALATYGEVAAHAMALEWCRKCQYYYDIYKEANDEHYVYSEADVADYREEATFLEFTSDLGAEHPAWKRLLPVRELAPTNPM
jgi:hypothetical protein